MGATVTTSSDITLITLQNCPNSISYLHGLLEQISALGINIDMISQSAPTGETADVSFTIDSKDLVRTLSIVQRFRVQYPNVRPSVSSGCCKIQLYGEEMRTRPGVAAQAFRLVSEQTGDIRLITTSEVDISILIAEHDLPAVLENLRAFFQV